MSRRPTDATVLIAVAGVMTVAAALGAGALVLNAQNAQATEPVQVYCANSASRVVDTAECTPPALFGSDPEGLYFWIRPGQLTQRMPEGALLPHGTLAPTDDVDIWFQLGFCYPGKSGSPRCWQYRNFTNGDTVVVSESDLRALGVVR